MDNEPEKEFISKILEDEDPLDDERLSDSGIAYPFVTVIVTLYNYEKYIASCLKSVARQKYPSFKCVIVDDCSKDASVERVNDFINSSEAGDRFTLICAEKNGGQMAAFKTGLAHAEGPFVVLLDADDLLLEDFIETHVRAHLRIMHLPVAFTSSNQYHIDENSQIVAGMDPNLQSGGTYRYVKPVPLFQPFWLWASVSSMMFRRTVLEYIMPENTGPFRICADYYLCHFAHQIGGSLLIPTVHGCYRRHGQNNFCCNPVVGRSITAGTQDRYPELQKSRIHILSHLLKNFEKFCVLFTEAQYVTLLLRVIRPGEIIRQALSFRKPNFFSRKSLFFTGSLFTLSCLSGMKASFMSYGRIRSWYRKLYDLSENH